MKDFQVPLDLFERLRETNLTLFFFFWTYIAADPHERLVTKGVPSSNFEYSVRELRIVTACDNKFVL